MRHRLILHPDSPASPVERIAVEVARGTTGDLALHYMALGQITAVKIPAPAARERADGLWQTSCFEAFVQPPGNAYVEYNLSPSGRWAAYRFEGYREGMAPLATRPPRIELRRSAQVLRLIAHIPASPGFELGQLALSAVIEDETGQKSYWALAFGGGPPDFHHPACFVAKLGAAGPE